MSHFECHLNRHFWRSKKVVQVAQIRGRGGGGHLDKIQTNSYFFSEAFPNCDERKDNFEEKNGV